MLTSRAAHFKSLRCSFQESTMLILRVFTDPASGVRNAAYRQDVGVLLL